MTSQKVQLAVGPFTSAVYFPVRTMALLMSERKRLICSTRSLLCDFSREQKPSFKTVLSDFASLLFIFQSLSAAATSSSPASATRLCLPLRIYLLPTRTPANYTLNSFSTETVLISACSRSLISSRARLWLFPRVYCSFLPTS